MEPLLIWGLSLLAAAALLLVIEIFVPSAGVIAVTATAVAIAGVVCLWRYDTLWGITGLIVVLVGGPGIFFYGLSIWRYTPLGRRMIGELSEEEQEELRRLDEKERDQRQSLMGAEGTAVTDLRPVGVVMINGQRHDALSESVLIPAGTRVRVTVVESNQLKVRPVA
jgi:membrane-bound serine protease (ClpP class)